MGRLNRVLTAAAFAGVIGSLGCPSSVAAQQSARRPSPVPRPEFQSASLVLGGAINGLVSDERGGPLAGAMVSVLGSTVAMTVTDAYGRFFLDKLPAGEYTLRAHLAGFAASHRENVRVDGTGSGLYRLQLRRLETPVPTTGTAEPVTARPIIAAGFALPQVTPPEADDSAGDDHSHTDTAWRLRHATRSILKDSASTVAVNDGGEIPSGSLFSGAKDTALSIASSLFGDLPFSGEVNLLTTGAFSPGAAFSGNTLPRGVAYLAIGAPTGAGDWTVRAAMSEGDLASWIVAGSFISKRGPLHSYDLGLSYSTQDYQGGNPVALAAMRDGSRNVGEVYGTDRWTVAPGVSIEYGGRYARYDYLERPGLFSPRAGFTLGPAKGTRVTAVVEQRMVAPGAEEFLSTGLAGPWLPPERTFSALAGERLHVERARGVDVGLEHEFRGGYVLGARRFFQGVDNQLVTLFGLDAPAGAQSVGHYYVASAGAFDAQGWGVRLTAPLSKRVHGTVDYTLTQSRWSSRGDLGPSSGLALRRDDAEGIHDVTTSWLADIPESATRVFVLYKVSSGYARGGRDLTESGLDGRFDVQVNQGLPFGFGNTKWEVLLGVRNLFRDPNEPASMYDELLVIRPPKRIVGGFLVRF
jgi:carboxypeptidase family protein/TonB-dependent receptor-like protein